LAAKFYHWILTEHKTGRTALDYAQKVRKITSEAIEIFQIGYAPQQDAALANFLVNKKGFNKYELVRAGLVYQKGNRIFDRFAGRLIFPIFDHRDNCVALAGRVLPLAEGSKVNNTA